MDSEGSGWGPEGTIGDRQGRNADRAGRRREPHLGSEDPEPGGADPEGRGVDPEANRSLPHPAGSELRLEIPETEGGRAGAAGVLPCSEVPPIRRLVLRQD